MDAHPPRRFPARSGLSAGLALALLACGVAPQVPSGGAARSGPGSAAAADPSPEGSASTGRPAPDPGTRANLIGWWLRHDQSYMMVLDAIDDDGGVEARYLNPEPVHVSRALAWIEDGIPRLLLELTDRNYPGNYYELGYRTDQDLWIGLYHHLGNGETYEVYFSRFEGTEDTP